MKSRVLSYLLIASASLSLTGCFWGQTHITASEYSSKPYEIYKDGEHICTMQSDNDCTISKHGASTSAGILEAYQDGQKVGTIRIKRQVTFSSLLWIPLTYGLSYWLYRAYPSNVEIPVYPLYKTNNNGNAGSSWDDPLPTEKSVWD